MGKIAQRLDIALSELAGQRKEKKEEIIYVPISKLKLNPNRVRRQINREDIQQMAENIKHFGILQPLEINSNMEVVLGNRRFEAAKLASLEYVPCIIRQSCSYYEIEKQLVSDIHSKNISILDKANAFKKLMELKGMSKYALAKYLNLSHNVVCMTMSILEANKTTVKLMNEGKISQKKVAMILYRLKNKQLEDFVVKEIIKKKMNIVQAGNFISEINNPELFKKHFIQRIKAFKTNLLNLKEKTKLLNLSEDQKKEIISELKKINFDEIFS